MEGQGAPQNLPLPCQHISLSVGVSLVQALHLGSHADEPGWVYLPCHFQKMQPHGRHHNFPQNCLPYICPLRLQPTWKYDLCVISCFPATTPFRFQKLMTKLNTGKLCHSSKLLIIWHWLQFIFLHLRQSIKSFNQKTILLLKQYTLPYRCLVTS